MTRPPCKSAHSALLLLLAATGLAAAQAIPAATGPATAPGFRLPTASGTLNYSASVSETASIGYQGENTTAYSTNFSGNVGYLSANSRRPFSLLYSAGYLVSTGSGQPSATYQNLSLSQVLDLRRYHLVFSDTVSYLPQAAAAGLSGIPGVGDANLPPGQFLTGANGVLSNYATRVDNTLSASVSRSLTAKTSLTTRGIYSVDRFLGGSTINAIESNSYSFLQGIERRIDSRTSFGGNYNFSRYVYLGQDLTTDSQGASLEFSRQFNRRSGITLSGGPQYITSSNSAIIPARLSFTANTAVSYSARDTGFSVGYNRSTGSGSGVVAGAITDSVQASAQRRFGPSLHASLSLAYIRTRSLSEVPGLAFNSNAVVGGFQANRAIIRYLSAYLSYTLQRQSYSGYTASNFTFNGLTQILGFGVTYAPESLRIGHH